MAAATTAAFSFSPGRLLDGKYRLVRVIGEGGLGVVLEAVHEQLEQRVAVKYLKARSCAHPVVRERFLREARLSARLQGEHVARVYDVGTSPEGLPYMVMEFLEGEDLGAVLARGPLPITTAVDAVLQACVGLAEMHALGIVHRDLKPENLFVASRAVAAPIIKVLDFGVSKNTGKVPGAKNEARLTGTTERFGTPQYMSPEQLRASADVDARSDIWSLGVVLHELLTGATPFNAESIPELCAAVLLHDYEGLETRPDVSPTLEAIVFRCLAKTRDQRYRNVAELAIELAPFGGSGATEMAERAARAIKSGGESIRVPRALPPPPRIDVPPFALVTTTTVGGWGDVPVFAIPRPSSVGPRIAVVVAALGSVLILCALLAATPIFRHTAPLAHAGRPLVTAFASAVIEDLHEEAPRPAPLPPARNRRARAPRY